MIDRGPTLFTQDAETRIPKYVPPSFLTSAGSGDAVRALWATVYFTAMLSAGVPNLETHIYGNGGLTAQGRIPFGTWTDPRRKTPYDAWAWFLPKGATGTRSGSFGVRMRTIKRH